MIFLGCCFYDALKPGHAGHHVQSDAVQEADLPAATSSPGVTLVTDPTESSPTNKSGYLSVDLCTSCGFKKRFDELRNSLCRAGTERRTPNGHSGRRRVSYRYTISAPRRISIKFQDRFLRFYAIRRLDKGENRHRNTTLRLDKEQQTASGADGVCRVFSRKQLFAIKWSI